MKKTLSAQVADGIRDYIATNSLKPGDRLPTEHELAEHFGVSRISVREATKALHFLGIVDSAPRRGLSVSQVDMKRASKFLGFHLAIGHYPLEQLVETRIVIETGGLPWLMKKLQEDSSISDRLRATNGELRACSDMAEMIALDIRFHRELLDASGLTPLLAFHDLLDIFFQRVRTNVPEDDWTEAINGHDSLIDHLQNGQLDSACMSLRSHIEVHLVRLVQGQNQP